jgi:hypothetical protein
MTDPVRIRKSADITPDMRRKVRECGMAQLSFKQAAVLADVEEVSLRRWLARDFNQAKTMAIKNVAAMVYNQAVGERDPVSGEWITRPHFGSQALVLKCHGGWRETTGIVFEDAKTSDDNNERMKALIEARFKRLGDMRKKRAAKASAEQTPEPPAPAPSPEAGNGPAVPG